MPNLISENNIPGGFFWKSDDLVDYNILELPDYDLPDDTILHFGVHNKVHYYKLTNKSNEKFSMLRLVPETLCNELFLRVSKISSIVKQKGYATTLYLAAIFNSKESVMSDTSLTMSGSYNIWRKLFSNQKENGLYKISYLNTKLCEEQDMKVKTARTQIWGFDEDLLEILNMDIGNLEAAYKDGDISFELYEYLRDYKDILRDKKHIRLIARK